MPGAMILPPGFASRRSRHYAHHMSDISGAIRRRRDAVVGRVTVLIATRLARRAAKKKLGVNANGGMPMSDKAKSAPQAVAARTAAVVVAVRPIVQRAMNDPELHAALRQAFDTGREVSGKVKGAPPKKAAKRLAKDRKLQHKVETSANDLKAAVTAVVKEPEEEKKGFFRRVIAPLAVIGGVAAGIFVLLRKRGGGSQETPY
jgi:hypothetical protein